ncbi:hypothetical protein VTH82DRAFT_4906 [Thermothelomyces myriococcoides]
MFITEVIPPVNDVSSNREGGDNNTDTAATLKTGWIGFVVFGICAMVLAIALLILFMKRNRAVVYRSDPESSTRDPRNNDSNSHRVSRRESAVFELGQCYEQLREDDAMDAKIPPTQRGPSVECVICLEPLQDQSLVRTLSCHHLFHADCVASWFRRGHNTCPICMTHQVSIVGSGGNRLPGWPPPVFIPF